MKKFLVFYPLLLFSSSIILCQTNTIDSLKAELNSAPKDSGKVILLNALIEELKFSNPDEASEYVNVAEDLASELGYVKGRIETILLSADIIGKKGNNDLALQMIESALELSKSNNLPHITSKALKKRGGIYYYMGDYAKAVNNFHSALEISEQINDSLLMSKLFLNIGAVYYKTGNNEKALNYYNKSIPIFERLNRVRQLATVTINIGSIYRDIKDFDEAKKYCERGLELANQVGDSLRISFALNNLSTIYYDQKDFETALEYVLKSYQIKKQLGFQEDIARAENNIGILYSQMGNFNKGIEFTMNGMQLAKEINAKQIVVNSYINLSEIYSLKKDYENAYKYSVLYSSLKDSLDEQGAAKIAEIQSEFKRKKLILENEKLQLEIDYRYDIITYQRITVIVSIALLFLISIFAIIFLWQKNKLNKLNSMKDKFFSIVAHDLRNPINSIQNIADLLASDLDESGDKDNLELTSILRKSTTMLTELISNLFAWSTFQQGIISFNPEKFNITRTLIETAETLKHSAADKNIELKYTGNSDLYVFADKKMVDSVVLNLITNAIKFTSQKNTITISVNEKDSFAEILIEDTGVGIPEEIQKSLFKIDTHISSPGTEGEKGTGLGLLICKELVEINNGKIWFESEVGIGSKFFVSLPLA